MGNRKGFTLVEMLVVMAIVGMLAGMLTAAVIYAHNLSIRVSCQENLRQIGTTVSMLVLNDSGAFPIYMDNSAGPWWWKAAPNGRTRRPST